jgi:hypothetical protein
MAASSACGCCWLLVPDGKNVDVTDSNKAEYVRLIAHHRMTSAIKTQVSFSPLFPTDLLTDLLACWGRGRLRGRSRRGGDDEDKN